MGLLPGDPARRPAFFLAAGIGERGNDVPEFGGGPFGDAAIAAMSIVSRVGMFAGSALIGFGQGFQPVCGFNYGAQLYGRVRRAFWFCIRVATAVLLLIAGIGLVYAPQIIALFRDDPAVIEIGAAALRFQCLTFPLNGWIILNNMMLQTIGKAAKATVLAMARQGLFMLPALLILTPVFGCEELSAASRSPILPLFCWPYRWA